MQCPVCKEGKLDLLRIVETKDKVLRLKRCMKCKRGFCSEELMFETTSEIGVGLKKELYAAIYGKEKAKDLFPPAGNPKQTRPKQRRKVAPPASERVEGEVYLTYGEIWNKFRATFYWLDITDYRPYPLLDYSIIIWLKDGEERAYRYIPCTNSFVPVENAKTYAEILEEHGRKKA